MRHPISILKTRVARRKASAVVETIFGIAFLLPLALLVIDGVFVLLAFMWNHDACCFAARTASNGPPNIVKPGEPRKRALEALSSASYPRSFMTIQPNIEVTEEVKPGTDSDVFGGTVDGTVTVATVAAAHPPFLLLGMLRQKEILVKSSQTYPFTGTLSTSSSVPLKH